MAPEQLVGQTAPATSVAPLQGNSPAQIPVDGRVTLVDFWATWCAPCRAKLVELEEGMDRLEDGGVSLIALNVDAVSERREEQVRRWLEDAVPLIPAAMDDGTAMGRWAVRSLPMAFTIDCEGRIVHRYSGSASTETMIEEALALAEACGSSAR